MSAASSSKIQMWLVLTAIILLLVAGVWGFSHFLRPGSDVAVAGGEIWTCSMHPQVRLPKPGKWSDLLDAPHPDHGHGISGR